MWLEPGASAPAGLLAALAEHGLGVTVVVDAAAALREVIRGRTRRVVCCEPARLARSGELFAVVRDYYPGVSCWQFDPAAETLTMMNGHAVDASTGTKETHQQSARSVDDPGEAADVPNNDGTAVGFEPPRPLITEEEVTMLLGPVPPQRGERTP